MVSIANDSVDQISHIYQKPNEPIKSELSVDDYVPEYKPSQFVNSEEPLIEVLDQPSGPDPLLINETGDSNNQWILLDCNGPKTRRSYPKRIVKDPKRLVKDPKRLKMLAEFPLKSMVYEALEAMPNIRGVRTRDIKRFLAKKYEVEFESAKITAEIQIGIAKGEILQFKRSHTKKPIGRYSLKRPKIKKAKVQSKTDDNGDNESLEKAVGSDVQAADMTIDIKNSNESVLDDNITKINGKEEIEMIDETPLATENTVTVESDLSVVNGESVDVLDLESKVNKVDRGPIHRDEIDFMVLHSLYCSPDSSGMRLDEIADFMYSFYDINAQRSLPYITKYLDYSIKKGAFLKDGDKYRKAISTWKFQSQGYSFKPVKQSNDFGNGLRVENPSSSSGNISLLNVELEPKDIANSSSSELVSNPDGTETNINDNGIESIDEKQVAEKITNKRYNLRNNNESKKKDVSTLKNVKNELPSNSLHQSKMPPHQTGLRVIDIAKMVSPQYVKVNRKFNMERVKSIEQPFVSYMRGEVIPFSFKNIKAINKKQDGCTHVMTELKDAFRTIKSSRQNLSDLRFKERDLPHTQQTSGKYATIPGLNLMDEHQSKFNFPVAFNEPKYTLAEINCHISCNPKTLLNTPAAYILWEHIAIRQNFSCLKLTGTSSSSNENLNCKICGTELKFGPSYCDVCSFELEHNIEKCNICHLFCNRGDVFHKHFIWEHRPSTQEVDYDSVSVIEQNIGSSLNKLATNNLFRCRLCMFLTNTIDVFESHLVLNHTSKVNVFPPLPELSVSNGVVIFQNEIENTCCHNCKECGFISNKTDYMVYHLLDVHVLTVKETYNDQYLYTDVEPMKKKQLGKVKWSYGLCHLCGKLYNNILHHLERHQEVEPSQQGANVRKFTKDLDEVELHIRQELLRWTDGRLKKPRRKRKIDPNKTFLCHICGKIVKRRLYAHIRIHNHELHACGICGREFNRQSNLLTHRRVHTREKPFQCDICKMMFGYKCSIKGHIINVHSDTVR